MSEYTQGRDDNYIDPWDDNYIDPQEEIIALAEEPEQEVVAEPEPVVEEPQAAAKPEFGLWAGGRYATKGGYQTTAHEGPAVEYINRVLGLSGDQYTKETFAAVKQHQRSQGLPPTGRVDARTYETL